MSPDASTKKEDNEESDNNILSIRWRKWFYTEFTIQRNDLVTLEVNYTIINNYEDYSTSKSSFSYYVR